MERYISLPEGGRVFATVEGAGSPVLFVHADFVDGGMWTRTMAALAAGHLVASYDKLGYGRSAAATGPVCRRSELAAVVAALGLGPVHLVGCSNGGQASLDLALEEPRLVRSLTLVNASPSGFEWQGSPPPEILEMMAASQRGDLAAASELQLRIWFDGPERGPDGLDPDRRAARAEAARMNRVFMERGTFFMVDARPAEPLAPPAALRLADLRQPTLVVAGVLDYAENRRASRILAEGIPGARLVAMADCAHVPPLEAPGEFSAILGKFLTEVESKPDRRR
ncbi:MAG: alpha/beta fold hydrolase [Rectinemataceae bacterium]